MKIATQSEGDEVRIHVEGRMDTTNYNEFENAVNEVLKENVKNIYVDLGELSYISSSGLRVLLAIQKKMMAAGGKIKLCALQPAIREIFDISGFSSIFPIFPDMETAKKS
jgi:anti-anti-sigma factor